MLSEIKQDELYEDLSTIIVLIKKFFRIFLLKHKPQESNQNKVMASQQAIIMGKCNQLTAKYKKIVIKKSENLIILGRFMCRIKEFLAQIVICIPKQKLQLMIILKKMELVASKGLSTQNSAFLIISLLEIISSCSPKLMLSLKIKSSSIRQQKQSKNNETIEKRSMVRDSPELGKPQGVPAQIKESQLDMFTKTIQKYFIMDIDKQFLRGRYFDLKSDENAAAYEEIMFRNRNIKALITQFDKNYGKFVNKKKSTTSSKKSMQMKEQVQNKPLMWQIHSPQLESSNLLKNIKRQISSRSARTPRVLNNKSNETFNWGVMQKSAQLGIQSYRSLYEQKTMRLKQKRTIKLSKTIIDVPSIQSNPHSKQINMQRVNFYKKSQQHLKFRYKYYQNQSFNTTPLNNNKYKTINPQIHYNNFFKK